MLSVVIVVDVVKSLSRTLLLTKLLSPCILILSWGLDALLNVNHSY